MCLIYANVKNMKIKNKTRDGKSIESGTIGYANPQTCFIAGTLVHTKEGLKPIEQIKVGDWVLSKPESGQGEQAYKRVTKTFEHWSNDLYLLSANRPNGNDVTENTPELTRQLDSKYGSSQQWIVTTGEHPFYNNEEYNGLGWVPAYNLNYTNKIQLVDGNSSYLSYCDKVYKTSLPNIGFTPHDPRQLDVGVLIDFSAYDFVVSEIDRPFRFEHEGDDFAYHGSLVYNIEVEDFHTYYVGELGIWVHNKSTILAHMAE